MQQMNNKKKYSVFIEELTNCFPEIKSEVLDKDYSGLISLQIGCFKRYTQKAIDSEKYEIVRKCFHFVDSNLGIVEDGIENALIISYLAKLEIRNKNNVEKILSQKMKQIINELNNYDNSNSKNSRAQNFLDNL